MQARFYARDKKNQDGKYFRYDILVSSDKRFSGVFIVEHFLFYGDDFWRKVESINGSSEKQIIESELNKAYSKFPEHQYSKEKLTDAVIQKNKRELKILSDYARKLGL
jgi:hypothetical protein